MIGIQNEHLLTDIFGRFPSFHDAELLKVTWGGGEPAGDRRTLEVLIHVWTLLNEVDEEDHLKTSNHVVVKFQFTGIVNLALGHHNQQSEWPHLDGVEKNILFALTIKKLSDREEHHVKFKVEFAGSVGGSAEFHCRDISIESVEPFDRTKESRT